MTSSWRRLSMRKTCPIVLPEQNSPKDASTHIARTLSSSTANRSHISVSDFNTDGNFTSVMNAAKNNEDYCFNDPITPSKTFANADLLSHSEDNEMTPITNNHQHHFLLNEYDSRHELPELSSLNNEFLNTILSTPNYQQSSASPRERIYSSQRETNCGHIEEDTECVTASEESRPRQLGRRSEMRSRIVSITAEPNSEGNHVSQLPIAK